MKQKSVKSTRVLSSAGLRTSIFVQTLGLLFLACAFDLALGMFLRRVVVPRRIKQDYSASAMNSARESWLDVYSREYENSQIKYVSFRHWMRGEVSGKTINIGVNGRHTHQPNIPDTKPLPVVYFFGGSAAWGFGARDDHTIPSELSRIAEASGVPIRVRNYAETAHVAWQQLIRFEELLAENHESDVVIFFDGYNDFWAQVQNASSQPVHLNFDRLRSLFEESDDFFRAWSATSAVARIFARKPIPKLPHPSEFPGLVERTARLHKGAIELAAELADHRGIQFFSFWQPCVYTKKLTAGEETILQKSFPLTDVYRSIPSRLSHRTVDLGNALDHLKEPTLIDPMHVNETGNREIAHEIFRHIEPALRERKARRAVAFGAVQ